MATAARSVLVLCEKSSTLYLLNPANARVRVTIQLPYWLQPASNLLLSRNRRIAYVAGPSLRLASVDLSRRRVTRHQQSGTVTGRPIGLPSIASSLRPQYAFAAMTESKSGAFTRIDVYRLPSLAGVASFVSQPYRDVAAAPMGVYTVPSSGCTTTDRKAYVARWQLAASNEMQRVMSVTLRGCVYSFASGA